MEIDIDRIGSVRNVRVKKSIQPGAGGLDEAAINAVRSVKFKPGKSKGKAVDTTVIMPVEFR